MRYQVPVKYWYNWVRGALEAEMNFIEVIVQKNDRVIDIGGNRGIYAYELWRRGALVEVFEPNPKCCRVLEAWASGRANVRVHSVALSCRTGTARLHIPIDGSCVEHDASGSIEHSGFALARDQIVPLHTLDSYQFEEIRLIKIDVEGHESSVIEGAALTIASSKPALLIEIEQRHIHKPILEVFDKVLGFGYRGFFVGTQGLTPLSAFNVDRHQSIEKLGTLKDPYVNNFLFLHRKRLANGEYSALGYDKELN